MTYLYAGLGIAMLTAIMAMFEMSQGITRQQMFMAPPPDPYRQSPSQAVDKALLSLIAAPSPTGLRDSSLEGPSLCGSTIASNDNDLSINKILRDHSSLYPALNGYTFLPSDLAVEPFVQGCVASSGAHRVYLVPTPNGPFPYSIFSCVLKDASECVFERS